MQTSNTYAYISDQPRHDVIPTIKVALWPRWLQLISGSMSFGRNPIVIYPPWFSSISLCSPCNSLSFSLISRSSLDICARALRFWISRFRCWEFRASLSVAFRCTAWRTVRLWRPSPGTLTSMAGIYIERERLPRASIILFFKPVEIKGSGSWTEVLLKFEVRT